MKKKRRKEIKIRGNYAFIRLAGDQAVVLRCLARLGKAAGSAYVRNNKIDYCKAFCSYEGQKAALHKTA